jgi:hypothetical protein
MKQIDDIYPIAEMEKLIGSPQVREEKKQTN